MAATVRADKTTALGRLLITPPPGLSPDVARIIDALAREAAQRDHAAETADRATKAA